MKKVGHQAHTRSSYIRGQNCSLTIAQNKYFLRKLKHIVFAPPYNITCDSLERKLTSIMLIMGHFCPFTWFMFQKIKSFENEKNHNNITCSIYLRQSLDKFFVIFGHFYPFPICGPKYQNFQKMKYKHGDIIVLHKCAKNHNHITWSSLDRVQTTFLLILGHFGPYAPFVAQKIKIFKKWKNAQRYYHFASVHQKSQS